MVLEGSGETTVIAEDLGVVPDYVPPTLQKLGIPGFRIPMLFREHDGSYSDPQNYPQLSVVQPATHDHPPLAAGWLECWQNIDTGKEVENSRRELRRLMEFAGIKGVEPPREFTEAIHEAFTRAVLGSNSWLAVFQITDVFAMTARFNIPGSVAVSNWSHRLEQTVNELDRDPVLLKKAERFSRLSAAAKGSAPVIDAAAHARFILVEQAFEEFVSIRFRSSRQAELVSALRAKNARLGKLLAAYAEVVAIGSPKWSEASFARIGEAYRDFNKGLLDAPMPRGLDPEQQDLYRTTLENQALPFEDKATEALAKAVQVSQASGVYSEWVVKAQDLLREYQPDAYGDVRRPRLVDTELSRAVTPGFSQGGH